MIDLNPKASKMFLQLQATIVELQARQNAILVGAGFSLPSGAPYRWKVEDEIVRVEEAEPAKLEAVPQVA